MPVNSALIHIISTLMMTFGSFGLSFGFFSLSSLPYLGSVVRGRRLTGGSLSD